MSRPRYAVYYAPPADSPLWRLASAWLGRDACTGAALARPPTPALADLDLGQITADPRGYGFHATLKAPFELADGVSEADLAHFTEAFAAAQTPFEAVIAPAALGRFLAFTLAAPCGSLQALHEACVEAFEPYRAPLSAHDLARRRKAPLTPAQDARLLRFGYPYVFEDFRFHMTLTGQIADEALRARVLESLTGLFAEVSGPHLFDGVAIFRQADRAAPFEVLVRAAFRAEVPVSP